MRKAADEHRDISRQALEIQQEAMKQNLSDKEKRSPTAWSEEEVNQDSEIDKVFNEVGNERESEESSSEGPEDSSEQDDSSVGSWDIEE
jgi:hypothetical protein